MAHSRSKPGLMKRLLRAFGIGKHVQEERQERSSGGRGSPSSSVASPERARQEPSIGGATMKAPPVGGTSDLDDPLGPSAIGSRSRRSGSWFDDFVGPETAEASSAVAGEAGVDSTFRDRAAEPGPADATNDGEPASTSPEQLLQGTTPPPPTAAPIRDADSVESDLAVDSSEGPAGTAKTDPLEWTSRSDPDPLLGETAVRYGSTPSIASHDGADWQTMSDSAVGASSRDSDSSPAASLDASFMTSNPDTLLPWEADSTSGAPVDTGPKESALEATPPKGSAPPGASEAEVASANEALWSSGGSVEHGLAEPSAVSGASSGHATSPLNSGTSPNDGSERSGIDDGVQSLGDSSTSRQERSSADSNPEGAVGANSIGGTDRAQVDSHASGTGAGITGPRSEPFVFGPVPDWFASVSEIRIESPSPRGESDRRTDAGEGSEKPDAAQAHDVASVGGSDDKASSASEVDGAASSDPLTGGPANSRQADSSDWLGAPRSSDGSSAVDNQIHAVALPEDGSDSSSGERESTVNGAPKESALGERASSAGPETGIDQGSSSVDHAKAESSRPDTPPGLDPGLDEIVQRLVAPVSTAGHARSGAEARPDGAQGAPNGVHAPAGEGSEQRLEGGLETQGADPPTRDGLHSDIPASDGTGATGSQKENISAARSASTRGRRRRKRKQSSSAKQLRTNVSRETLRHGEVADNVGEDEVMQDEAAIAVREAALRAAAEVPGVSDPGQPDEAAGFKRDVSRETSNTQARASGLASPGAETVDDAESSSEEITPRVDLERAARDARVTFRISRGPYNRFAIAVANQKGGVGKSTTAVNLGAYLALAGARVLVVDLDPQGNASTGLGLDHRQLEPSVYDVLMGDSDAASAIHKTPVENLDVLPSTIDLAGAEVELVNAFSRETRLRQALGAVRYNYDLVFIDCPPSLGLLTVNALAAADELLIPIQCEYYALEGLGQLLRNVDLVRVNLNQALHIGGIVLTMYDGRTRLAEQVVQEVRKHFTDLVYQTVVPRSVRLSESPGYGVPIALYDPLSRGGIAYRDLALELADRTGLLAPTQEGAK